MAEASGSDAATAGNLVARAAEDLGEFNWPFLIWLLAFAVVAVLFLFYFNRIIAFALFGLIRLYTWLFYRIHVKCQSVQFSLLGGRIFFRGLEYHGENETILCHQAYITWRYWYRRVADVYVNSEANIPNHSNSASGGSFNSLSEKDSGSVDRDKENGAPKQSDHAPCRISAHLRGVEWFVYNRSPAFDAILAAAATAASSHHDARASVSYAENGREAAESLSKDAPSKSTEGAETIARPPYQSFVSKPQVSPPAFLKLLPISVECSRAAMVMGNQHTRSITVAKVEHANGKITAGPCGAEDQYRQIFDFIFEKPMLRFIPNEGYVEPLLSSGARLNGMEDPQQRYDGQAQQHPKKVSRHRVRHALSQLFPGLQRSVESFDRRAGSIKKGSVSPNPNGDLTGETRWIGLGRYLDEEEEDQLEHERWRHVEYAKEYVIADCPSMTMNFYWDVPGNVVDTRKPFQPEGLSKTTRDINSSSAPEWGLELRIGGGVVNYGPWADRQRVDLMGMFFPSAYANAVPALPLKPGQARISTVFQILITLDAQVRLRLHTKEPSKDWKYKGIGHSDTNETRAKGKRRQTRSKKQTSASTDAEDRPAGWMDVSFEENTTVSYNMDMVPRTHGFSNKLTLDVVSPIVTSSVNSDLLLRSRSMTISCDLSNPLHWNEARTWRFDISSHGLDLFMLREHAFLVQDLVEDFTSGPLSDFYTFVPFHYLMKLDFYDLKVYLNANDLNIIDNPSDVSDNTSLVLQCPNLIADLEIPADQLQPQKNAIAFSGRLEDTIFEVLTPTWNTYNTLLQDSILGTFPKIIVDGSYTYFSGTGPSLTDTLLMQIHGVNPKMILYGFLIRYFMTFRDNYFGEDVHFQTVEEYQGRLQSTGRKHEPDNDHKPAKNSNDLDVILSITTENPCVVLPSRLYSAEECVKVDMENGSADLRFTNYYMDLQTSISPLSLSHTVSEDSKNDRNPFDIGVQTFVDGITITGHRLFGLPPLEPTYVCNWDFEVGNVSGEASLEYLGVLVAGIQCLLYSLDDRENGLPEQQDVVLHDTTFLRASISPVCLWLHVDHTAFLCNLAASRIEFNDWARRRFSDRLYLSVPQIVLAAVESASTTRSRYGSSLPQKVITYGYLETSLDLRLVQTKSSFIEKRQNQQEHMRLHDARTNRTPWLCYESELGMSSQFYPQLAKVQPPASPFPSMPEPLRLQKSEGVDVPTDVASIISMPATAAIDRRIDAQNLNVPCQGASLHESAINPLPSTLTPWKTPSTPGTLNGITLRSSQDPDPLPVTSTVSSSYERPYFPLLAYWPTDEDVPVLNASGSRPADNLAPGYGLEDTIPNNDDDLEHTTIMITFNSGLRIMCTPPALESTNKLLADFQSQQPEALLDQLQMGSISAEWAMRHQMQVPRSVQVRLSLPSASVRLRHHNLQVIKQQDEQQTYELALQGLIAIGRLGTDRGPPHGRTPSSIHTSLEKAELEARRTRPGGSDEARLMLQLTELTAWAFSAEENSAELKFRSLEMISLNEKIASLATLVNEAGTLADTLGASFQQTVLTQAGRTQLLVYSLLHMAKHIGDPEILSSAAFVSRRWEDAIRSSDSWKMIMRLRWILKGIDKEAGRKLSIECCQDVISLPADYQGLVISKFLHWREWDLENIRASSLMNQLYGKLPAAIEDRAHPAAKPTRISFHSGIISLIIDPAQRRNRIFLEGLAAALQSAISITQLQVDNSEAPSISRKSNLELSYEKLLLEAKIEILDAVKDIFAHVKAMKAKRPPVLHGRDNAVATEDIEQQFHLVLSAKRSELRLRTKHLEALLKTEQLGSSLVASLRPQGPDLATALVTAQKLSGTILSGRKPFLSLVARQPSVYGNMQSFSTSQRSQKDWKIGAMCQRIEFDVLQSALGLLGIADQLLSDEFIFLQTFAKEVVQADELSAPSASEGLPTTHIVHVTLQLQSYRITSVLFSTLRYCLEGRVARSSFTPNLSQAGSSIVDIDIKHNTHILFNVESNGTHEISRLVLPPINARVGIARIDLAAAFDVSVHVEKIAVDASAIHGLFTTLSRKEITEFGQNVMRDVSVVKANFESAKLVKSQAQTDSQSPRLAIGTKDSGGMNEKGITENGLFYSAKLDFTGLVISASTSKTLKTQAEMLIDSGPIHFGITNQQPRTGALIPFPDLTLNLEKVSIVLESLHDGRRIPCGGTSMSLTMIGKSELADNNQVVRAYHAALHNLNLDVYTETASMIIDILGFLQQRFKRFNLSEELHDLRARRRKRARSYVKAGDLPIAAIDAEEDLPVSLFDAIFTFQIRNLQASWRVNTADLRSPVEVPENLIFSIKSIDLQTKKGNTARLQIQDLQLQMVPATQPSSAETVRSRNSALLPEVIFKVAYISRSKDRRIALQAIGKSLDIRLSSRFILPAVNIQRSIAVATSDLRQVLKGWNETLIKGDSQQKSVLGEKSLASLIVDADFAGAVVLMEGQVKGPETRAPGASDMSISKQGRWGQFTQTLSRNATSLKSPGLAFKVEYSDTARDGRYLSAEVKIAGSNNILYPIFVPLVLELMSSFNEVVGDPEQENRANDTPRATTSNDNVFAEGIKSSPTAILGDTKLNLGLRICEQSFSLTCEPIARVTATAKFKDIYVTVGTVKPKDQERFFALSSTVSGLEATVQHVYSREPTGRFEIETISHSLMNSKHVSGMNGLSSILNVSPMRASLNVKQLQDFLLFREIWYPVEIRRVPSPKAAMANSPVKSGVQRYKQALKTSALSWNAAIYVARLEFELDLGQALGRLYYSTEKLWLLSKMDSEHEQNLCLGIDSARIISKGRLSASIELRNLRLRTNIMWPEDTSDETTPLVQASFGFDDLRAKAAFDYQTFAIADFQSLAFLLYNVTDIDKDRLVCIVNGDKIQAYCTANAAAQSVALYQAIDRLIQEKQAAFQSSLKEMEKFQRQKSTVGLGLVSSSQETSNSPLNDEETDLAPVRLQVNVVVSLNALRAGVYPRAFRDPQILKIEALDALARFTVNIQDGKVHTLLTIVMGQLRVALSTIERGLRPKSLGDDVSVEEVVGDSAKSRGGTILKVPRVIATMQTWQAQNTKIVEYIFKSTFEGKVEVGWNYSRISFIRGMWDMHSRALVQRLGKMPSSAVQITSSPRLDAESGTDEGPGQNQDKITAVVNVAASTKYNYKAREPPIIQTPQLRDMGEATPPLEWIGLQRDRLPHLTHQIMIVPLLEFAKEVEDAYGRILGAS